MSHENNSDHHRCREFGQKWYSPRATALMRLPIDSKALPQYWMAKRHFPNGRPPSWRAWLIMVAICLCLAACNNQPSAAHGFPPAEVTVSKPEKKEVVNWNEFTGRTAAVNLVTVTPRVSGYIVNIPFKEGDIVHKGDLLFQIDLRPYQDIYEQTVGQFQQAQANQQLQNATFDRQQRLRETGSSPRKITIRPCPTRTKPRVRSVRLKPRSRRLN
jgi:hypothetical protein